MRYPFKYTLFFLFFLGVVQTQHSYATEISYDVQDNKEFEDNANSGNEKWTGIDVSIVGMYAEKYGHPPRDPYINTDQGDLLLFVFTAAGVIGGFVIGYNSRKLFIEGKDNKNLSRKSSSDNTVQPDTECHTDI